MQFRVPQFIDVEDKIFGPLTFKQFIYLVGGAALCFVLWKVLPAIVAIVFMTPVATLSLALAFLKINNKPFIFTLEAFLKYSSGTKLYIWKKETKSVPVKEEKEIVKQEVSPDFVPKLSGSKLKDLSWSLDVLDSNKK